LALVLLFATESVGYVRRHLENGVSGRGTPFMYIVVVATECAPAAKVGGLGDVVFGLSRELEVRGNSVEIILPKYDCMRYDQIFGLQVSYQDLWVPWYDRSIHCSVYFGFVHGRKCYFIEPHSEQNFFNRRLFYGSPDDDQRFAFFCRATLEFMWKSGKHPEIIHCHDWQTGLVPVLLYEIYKQMGMTHPRVCYTLHNLFHQGVTREHILRATGLNRHAYFYQQERLQDNANPAALNLLKGGIVYSNFVTTVSPRYAWEIMNTDQSCGLGLTLGIHRAKVGGILNGVDYDVWNPEIDGNIACKYGVDSIDNKFENKRTLRERFWLQNPFKPIVCFVGRLDNQKGVPLITHAIPYCLSNGCQFVLLGTGAENRITQHFLGLKRQYNDNPDCHLEIGYNEELSHLIYAGSDMILVPSLFEPCGLTQLIGLKYGTVPIVRATGGLADTVFDANYAQKPYNERNGYVFNDFNAQGLESALHRAIGLWYEFPMHFRELEVNGMRRDFSWNHPARHYLDIYEYIRDK
jgi:starch synthase